jgi:hypothetical protein
MTFVLAEDAALKSYLSGMTVSDEKNATRAVGVWFGYPDVEIRQQIFPFVTIELIDIRPANDRQTYGINVDNDYMGTVASTSNHLYEYTTPIAYDLEYQLTTYARHPRHDRAIILQMHRKFPSKYGFLPVLNDLGTETSHRHMFVEYYSKRDTVDNDATSGNKRLLRNVYTVRVVSELTPEQISSIRTVDEVLINQGTLSIPSGFTPV